MRLMVTALKLKLTDEQRDQVNEQGWDALVFGPAYLDLMQLRGQIKTSDLFTALEHGLYQTAAIFSAKTDKPRTGPGCSTEDLQTIADQIFHLDNIGTNSPGSDIKATWRAPQQASLSVGDLLLFGPLPLGQQSILACASFGWQLLNKCQEDLTRNKTHKDRVEAALDHLQATG